ncbi:Crp/Fnr family transcriptional regulator [Streptomyces sp. CA-111067]|uniref:Crp/Fnr family transcriptional regulator n=1 Tax=Streptomyces sp. CA-111067 TaxID=3240046 RepID=UPI003D97D5C4
MERAMQGSAGRGTDHIGGPRPARFLSSLSGPVREELLSIGSPQKYPPGEKILVEGAPGDYLVLLRTGCVKVTGRLGNGHDALIGIRVGGDVVGEMAVIEGAPRSATVTACEDIDAHVVQGRAMRSFLDKWPEAAIQIARLSNRRERTANSWRIAFSAFPARVRLARALVELAENHGRLVRTYGRPARSYTLICVNLTHIELAGLIGARQGTVQKTLATFRAEGIVATANRRMEVFKLDRLRAIGLLPAIGR